MYLDTLKFLFVLMESEHVQGLRAVHEVCTPAPLLSLARAITVHAGFLRKLSLTEPSSKCYLSPLQRVPRNMVGKGLGQTPSPRVVLGSACG